MSENTLAPRIKFYQNHRPGMEPGMYEINLEGSVTHASIRDNNTTSLVRKVAVYGERFSLNDQAIRAVFPAPGSTGAYSTILPHVMFKRNTLPWERQAWASDKDLPWLALLMFDEEEAPKKQRITVKDFWKIPSLFPKLKKELAQTNTEKLTVIDVPKTLLDKIMPTTASLKLLAHTRQGVDTRGNKVGEEHAVVFCNRLPAEGKRSVLHLVSVEGRYDENGFVHTGRGDTDRLVSLKSWDFYSLEHFKITNATKQALKSKHNASNKDLAKLSTLLDREFAGTEDQFWDDVVHAAGLAGNASIKKADLVQGAKFDKTFDGLLKNLSKDLLTFRLPKNRDKAVEKYFSQGLSPLIHHFRNGDRSVSWYRGPFLPFKPNEHETVKNNYPETADELLQFYGKEGMFDATYAVAWEIGRMMALSNKGFSTSLYQWKRYVKQHGHKKDQSADYGHLPVFAHSGNDEKEKPIWEHQLQPWLTQLANLQSMPGNYLIPDEKLLPQESIRFFYIDKNWLTAALCGAFSIGGEWNEDSQKSRNAFTDFLNLEDAYQIGFLIRSDVVPGWPGLIIDGIDANGNKLTPLRRRLSKHVLLCLFNKEFKQVVFHQKPEIMHFGVTKENEAFKKAKRNAAGEELSGENNIVDVSWKSAEARVIDVAQLANSLGKANKPAEFAMNMIEGMAKVVFNLEH